MSEKEAQNNEEQTPVNTEQTPVDTEQTPANTEQTPVDTEQQETVSVSQAPKIRMPKEGFSVFFQRAYTILLLHPFYCFGAILLFAALDSAILQGVFSTFGVDGTIFQGG